MMPTLAAGWAERLAELRGRLRESGERLDARLRARYRAGYQRQWWRDLEAAVYRGDAIPDAVWRSAEKFADSCGDPYTRNTLLRWKRAFPDYCRALPNCADASPASRHRLMRWAELKGVMDAGLSVKQSGSVFPRCVAVEKGMCHGEIAEYLASREREFGWPAEVKP